MCVLLAFKKDSKLCETIKRKREILHENGNFTPYTFHAQAPPSSAPVLFSCILGLSHSYTSLPSASFWRAVYSRKTCPLSFRSKWVRSELENLFFLGNKNIEIRKTRKILFLTLRSFWLFLFLSSLCWILFTFLVFSVSLIRTRSRKDGKDWKRERERKESYFFETNVEWETKESGKV